MPGFGNKLSCPRVACGSHRITCSPNPKIRIARATARTCLLLPPNPYPPIKNRTLFRRVAINGRPSGEIPRRRNQRALSLTNVLSMPPFFRIGSSGLFYVVTCKGILSGTPQIYARCSAPTVMFHALAPSPCPQSRCALAQGRRKPAFRSWVDES